MSLQLSTDFVVGLIIGGVVGLIVGFLVGVVSGSKKGTVAGKKTQAQKLFDSAMREEDHRTKLKVLARVVEKFPDSEWSDKALEQAMKTRQERESGTSEPGIEANQKAKDEPVGS